MTMKLSERVPHDSGCNAVFNPQVEPNECDCHVADIAALEAVVLAAYFLRSKPINTNPEWVRPLDDALAHPVAQRMVNDESKLSEVIQPDELSITRKNIAEDTDFGQPI